MLSFFPAEKQFVVRIPFVEFFFSVAFSQKHFQMRFFFNGRRFDLGFRATPTPIEAGHSGPNVVASRQDPGVRAAGAPSTHLCYLAKGFRRKPQARQSWLGFIVRRR